MLDRFVIRIQNPEIAYEVFVWDRQNREVVYSTAYPGLSIDAQRQAKARCQAFINQQEEVG